MSETVIDHVLGRFKSIGIDHIFGVPGDYAFGCCNELSPAYAAEGYSPIHGIDTVNRTYGVGELSAINGIAGAYTEYPVRADRYD